MEPKVSSKQEKNKNSDSKKNLFQKSPQDQLFVNHINYLNEVSYSNLIDFNNEELSRENQHTIKKLTNKKPIKLSPDLKYFYCKKCEIMLVPGETSKIRVKSKREKHMVSTCLNCGTIKRYNLINKNKKQEKKKKKSKSKQKPKTETENKEKK